MLFNYPPVSFTLSDILPLISLLSPHHSLYSLPPISLPLPISLGSLCSFPLRRKSRE